MKVVNWSEFHFSEVTFFQNWYFSWNFVLDVVMSEGEKMGGQLVKNLPSPLVRIGLTDLSNMGGRQSPPSPPPLCVEMGFTWTFHRNQDATVKLKTVPISIKF